MDGGAWWTTVHGGHKELDTTERLHFHFGIYGSSDSKEPACIAGDLNLILGLRKSPGEGKSYPLQYSGLENSMDCIIHSVVNSRIQLSDFHINYLDTVSDT